MTPPALHVDLGWGADAIRALAADTPTAHTTPHAAGSVSVTVVVIDVLSFSTAVDVATARGAIVFPWHEGGPSAVEAAQERQAVLAANRTATATTTATSPWTLSPASLQTIPPGTRLLLPSPNGATISGIARAQGRRTVAGCLRNASAVGHWLAQTGGRVLLVPAGEWTRSSAHGVGTDVWRTALEDWLGAGAIATVLQGHGATLTPEAQDAAARFARCVSDLRTHLSRCASGRELIERGFRDDVHLAAQHDVSSCVPLLEDGVGDGVGDGYSNANAAPSA